MSRLALLLGSLLLPAGLAACAENADGGGDGGPDTVGDATGDVGEELLPGQICHPGTAQECIVEGGKEAVVCNASGTAWVEGVCKGPDGRDSQCVGGSCTTCFPGTLKCRGEDEVLRCAEDGSEWELQQRCQGGTTGQVCALELTGNTCESLCSINVKFNSYIGCDYWGADLDNAFVPSGRGFYDAAAAQYAIAVGNPPDAPLPAIVEVWYYEDGAARKVPFQNQPGSTNPREAPLTEPIPDAPLMPGEIRVLRLPRRDVDGTVQAPLAYRITGSVPIFAYQFNPLENEQVFSNDASLLLPATLLGREYLVMTREQTFETLRSYLTVVAVLPGKTTVSVDLTGSTLAGEIASASGEVGVIPHMKAGQTRIFELEQYDVLNIETDRPGEDLTGSRILADKRVAVFGGSEAANAPNTARCVDIDETTNRGVCEYDGETSCKTLMDCVSAGFNTCCADHLEQQLFPLKTWGSSYVATKSWDRGEESDIYRIMAGANNTKVVLVPPQQGVSIPVLDKGEWFEFESRQDFEIHASDDKPILVGQFLAAQDAPEPNVSGPQPGDAGTGDPAFMLAVPVQQYRRDLVVYTPAEYQDSYLNITTLTGSQVTLDGEELSPGVFSPVGSGEYSVYRTRVEPGHHTITSSEPAGVIVYGYDQYVSYAYTGGLSLEELNSENPFGP